MSNAPVNKWLNGPVHPLLKVNLTELRNIDQNEKRCCSHNFKFNKLCMLQTLYFYHGVDRLK